MKTPFQIVLLLDSDPIKKLINQKIINASNFAKEVLVYDKNEDVFDYLNTHNRQLDLLPQFIFLDYDASYIDGQQFLEEYSVVESSITDHIKLVVLSNALSPQIKDKISKDPHVFKILDSPLTIKELESLK